VYMVKTVTINLKKFGWIPSYQQKHKHTLRKEEEEEDITNSMGNR
jgi:hypothetical protein